MALQNLDIPRDYEDGEALTANILDEMMQSVEDWALRTNRNLDQLKLDIFGTTYVYDNDGGANRSTPLVNSLAVLDVASEVTANWEFSGDNDHTGESDFSTGTVILPASFTVDQTAFDYTVQFSNPAAARTVTVPDPGANANFVMTEGTQTINGDITFNGDNTFADSSTFTSAVLFSSSTLFNAAAVFASTASFSAAAQFTSTVTFTGAITLPDTDPPTANTLVRKSTVKAWAKFDVTAITSCTIQDSFNVDSITISGWTQALVDVDREFSTAQYAVSYIATNNTVTPYIGASTTAGIIDLNGGRANTYEGRFIATGVQ